MTASQFSCQGIALSLFRYPKQQESNLQAWDAGDEHLVKHLLEHQFETVNTAIINDSFGALQCALTSINPTWPLMVETDAKTSLLGAEQNLLANQLNNTNISYFTSLS